MGKVGHGDDDGQHLVQHLSGSAIEAGLSLACRISYPGNEIAAVILLKSSQPDSRHFLDKFRLEPHDRHVVEELSIVRDYKPEDLTGTKDRDCHEKAARQKRHALLGGGIDHPPHCFHEGHVQS